MTLLCKSRWLPGVKVCFACSLAGMCGFSMGGVHASMTAALFPGNVACTPLLAPRSAAVAFCSGALQHATTWRPLTAPADRKQRVSCAVECIRNAGFCGMQTLGMLRLQSASPDSVALQAESQHMAAIDCTCRPEAGCQLGCRAFLQCTASMHGQHTWLTMWQCMASRLHLQSAIHPVTFNKHAHPSLGTA